jgi:hypothetical protein
MICSELNSATLALTRAFCATDYADLYNAQISQLLTDCITALDELTILKGYVEHEVIIFPHLVNLPPTLSEFIAITNQIIIQISGYVRMYENK